MVQHFSCSNYQQKWKWCIKLRPCLDIIIILTIILILVIPHPTHINELHFPYQHITNLGHQPPAIDESIQKIQWWENVEIFFGIFPSCESNCCCWQSDLWHCLGSGMSDIKCLPETYQLPIRAPANQDLSSVTLLTCGWSRGGQEDRKQEDDCCQDSLARLTREREWLHLFTHIHTLEHCIIRCNNLTTTTLWFDDFSSILNRLGVFPEPMWRQ